MILYNKKSHYHHIRVRQDSSYRYLEFLNNLGGTSLLQSGINLLNPHEHVVNYARFFLHGLYCSSFKDMPSRVLIIGLGGGVVPSKLRHLLPNVEIDIIEIDPEVLHVAKSYFNFKEGNGVRVHLGDAWHMVERMEGKYDWIMLDAFDHRIVPVPLLTDNFHKKLKVLLRGGGLFSVNLSNDNPYYKSHIRTLMESYGFEVWEVGNKDLGNSILHFGEFCNLGMNGHFRGCRMDLDSLIYGADVLSFPI